MEGAAAFPYERAKKWQDGRSAFQETFMRPVLALFVVAGLAAPLHAQELPACPFKPADLEAALGELTAEVTRAAKAVEQSAESSGQGEASFGSSGAADGRRWQGAPWTFSASSDRSRSCFTR